MANPQVEQGYTRIANELMAALSREVDDTEALRMMLCIIRYTYGYRRKKFRTSFKSLAKLLDRSEEFVMGLLRDMYAGSLIDLDFLSEKSIEVGIQKDYHKWSLRGMVI